MDYKSKIKGLEEQKRKLIENYNNAIREIGQKYGFAPSNDKDLYDATTDQKNDPRIKGYSPGLKELDGLLTLYKFCDKHDIAEEDAKICFSFKDLIDQLSFKLFQNTPQDKENNLRRAEKELSRAATVLTPVQKRAILQELETEKEKERAMTSSANPVIAEDSANAVKIMELAQNCLKASTLSKSELEKVSGKEK